MEIEIENRAGNNAEYYSMTDVRYIPDRPQIAEHMYDAHVTYFDLK